MLEKAIRGKVSADEFFDDLNNKEKRIKASLMNAKADCSKG